MSYQHQHVGNHDDVGLAPGRHGRLKVVLSVFPVGHGEVGMKRDVVLPDGLPGKKNKKKNTRDKAHVQVLVLVLPSLRTPKFKQLAKKHRCLFVWCVTAVCVC